MATLPVAPIDDPFAELLGTFLQVSAPYAPASLPLRQAADRFRAWALKQPVARLDHVYDHLLEGRMDPQWDELGIRTL
jgi:hypothetical protein